MQIFAFFEGRAEHSTQKFAPANIFRYTYNYDWIHVNADDPSVRVHGNLAHEVFDGTIIADEEMYHIEPSRR